MDSIVITIHPAPSDEERLRVADAMQQVLDAIRVFEDAERGLGSPHEAFEWRLERASTNSPFTVVATAKAKNPTVNVSAHVRRVKREVSKGFRDLVRRQVPPTWMTPETAKIVECVFARNRVGIGLTDIDFDLDNDVFSIDRETAEAGLRALAAINALDAAKDIPEREAYGEIEGVMLAVGRYRKRPAIQIHTDLYGFIWCPLSSAVIEQFGSESKIADVWEGKTLGVTGILSYAEGGRLTKIEALEVREFRPSERVNLDALLDPDFTSGLDPQDYLDKLHAGNLA